MKNTSVLSPGPTTTGGFYDFHAKWRTQQNKGVNWITDFTSIEENASRLRAIKLSDGETILVLYEIWTGKKFVSSQLMTLDLNGRITRGPRTARVPYDLPYADDLSRTAGNTAVFFSGGEGKLIRFEVSVKNAVAGRTTTTREKEAGKGTTTGNLLNGISVASVSTLCVFLYLFSLTTTILF